jgi:hypothetical protein
MHDKTWEKLFCTYILMFVRFFKDNKINHENTHKVSVQEKTEKHEKFYGLFVISTFRDFVIKDLFFDKPRSMLHANQFVGVGL